MFAFPETLTTQDLSTEVGLQAYLEGTPFAASSIVRLSGGFSCFTFRATLDAPYEDKDSGLVVQSVVIKHAREYSANYRNVPLSVERMDVEIAALHAIPDLPFYRNSISPKVRITRVLAHDEKNHIAIIEDFGALLSLKDYILTSTSSAAATNITPTSHEIGEILGQFLAHMHLWGYKLLHLTTPVTDSTSADISILDPFRNNAASSDAKKLCAWRTAGRLSEIAGRYEAMSAECDWDALTKRLKGDVLAKEETFTMGDFWTGNILVKTAPVNSSTLEQLVILDWELSKLGASSADIGQFAAESLLLARYATLQEPGRALFGSFMDTYEATLISEVNGQSVDDDGKALATLFDANAIVGCTAAHTAVWGTLGPWNVDAEVKERAVKGALKVCAASARGEFKGSRAKDLTKIWDGK